MTTKLLLFSCDVSHTHKVAPKWRRHSRVTRDSVITESTARSRSRLPWWPATSASTSVVALCLANLEMYSIRRPEER